MGNEVVKASQSAPITVTSGMIQTEGLTPEQQNELRMLAAKKGLELTFGVQEAQVRMQASEAELNLAKGTIAEMSSNQGSFSAKFTGKTVTGEYEIKAKKGLFL